MVKEDVHNLFRKLDRDTEKYLSRLFPEDREDVKRYINDLLAQGYSAGHALKYLNMLSGIRKTLKKPYRTAKEDDIKSFIAWLEKSDYTEWTKHGFKVILRTYLRRMGRGDVINWLKIRMPKNRTLPEEVLTEDNIKALVSAAYTSRDKAFILSLYESGCRIGEFLPMKLKHVTFDKYGTLLRVTGKTGDRRIRMVASTLSLQSWLNEHPTKDNPEAYLWCKIPTPNNPKWKMNYLTYDHISKHLKELAKKAKITKGVNPHAFRHARATFMARHLKEPEMREFFGWSKDSDMTSVYVTLSGRDVDNAVLSVYGIKDTEKSQETIIKTWNCPRCNEINEPASRFCKKCGLPIEATDTDKMESLLLEFLNTIGEAFPQAKEKFKEIARERKIDGLFNK